MTLKSMAGSDLQGVSSAHVSQGGGGATRVVFHFAQI